MWFQAQLDGTNAMRNCYSRRIYDHDNLMETNPKCVYWDFNY